MKFLKLKSNLFSLMTIAMLTVFLNSCEKEAIQNENQPETNEDSIEYFILPELFNDMSNEEFFSFFNEKTEDKILEIAEILSDDHLEERWCTKPVILGSYCSYNGPDCYRQERIIKRYYCDGPAKYITYRIWGNCCEG